MPETDHLIPYALQSDDHPADRLLRRIVGWSALLYGGEALFRSALQIALARAWLATPKTMGWDLGGGWNLLVMAVQTLDNCAMTIAGVLLLRRWRASVPLLRAAVACQLALSVISTAMYIYTEPVYASYWSKPGPAAVEAMGALTGLWLPVVLVLLTLPPLARRMT